VLPRLFPVADIGTNPFAFGTIDLQLAWRRLSIGREKTFDERGTPLFFEELLSVGRIQWHGITFYFRDLSAGRVFFLVLFDTACAEPSVKIGSL